MQRIATTLAAAVSAVRYGRWCRPQPLAPNATGQLAATASPWPYVGNGSADGCRSHSGPAELRSWCVNSSITRVRLVAECDTYLTMRPTLLATTAAPQRHGSTGGHGFAVALQADQRFTSLCT